MRVAVVLVHGTWARGIVPHRRWWGEPRWFEQGSRFRERLLAELLRRGCDDVSFDTVEWSGSNSIRDRDAAARTLAFRLDVQHAGDPSAVRLVIGHSHGGNVCLRAFAHLTEPADGVHVATVATPFVELLEGASARSGTSMVIAWFALVALLLRIGEWAIGRPPMPFVQLLGVSIGFGTVAGIVLLLLVFRQGDAKRVTLIDATSQGAFRKARAPTLVLRGVDDEASFALVLGAIAARLAHVSTALAAGFAERAWKGLRVLVAVAGVTGLVFAALGTSLSTMLKVLIALTVVVFGPLIAGLVVGFALLEGVAPAVFGRELFLTFHDVQVSANSAPDGDDHVRVVTLPPATPHGVRHLLLDDPGAPTVLFDRPTGGLRHALYDHPACAALIALWLAGRIVRGADASTPAAPAL